MTECMGCHGKTEDGIDPISIGWRQANFGLKGILVWMCERCATLAVEGLVGEKNGELLVVPVKKRWNEGVEVFRNNWGAAFVAWRREGSPASIIVAGKETVLQDYLVGAAFCHMMDLPRTSWSRRDWRIMGEEIAIGRMVKRRGLIRTEVETPIRRVLLMALLEPHFKRTPGSLLSWSDLDLAVARWRFKPYAWNEAGSFVNWYGKFLAHLYVVEVAGREQKKETEGMLCLMEASRRAVEKQADKEIVGFLQGTIDEVEGNNRKGT